MSPVDDPRRYLIFSHFRSSTNAREEIRNNIYALALGVEATSRDGPLLNWSSDLAQRDAISWSTTKRQFLGLTQVCRELRAEFLPVYMETIRVRINLDDIYKYLLEYVRVRQTPRALLKGNIVICILDEPKRKEKWVDIRPLILLQAEAPGLKLGFAEKNLKHLHMNQIFTASKKYPRLYDVIRDRAQDVSLQISPQYSFLLRTRMEDDIVSCFRVYMKDIYAEDWMRHFESPDWPHRRDD